VNIQSRLQYRTAALKIKLYDNAIRKKSLDVRAIRISVDENFYADKELSIVDHGIIDAIIKIPGGDLQAFQGQRDSNNTSYNAGVSIYSLLPIEMWVASDSQINKDDIILYKILRNPLDDEVDQEAFIQALQVSNVVSRATTTILYNVYTVAPYNFNMDEYPELHTIIENYRLEPIDLWS